jgi:hypothetical protein
MLLKLFKIVSPVLIAGILVWGPETQAALELTGQCRDHTFSYYEYLFALKSEELAQLPIGTEVRMISSFRGEGSVNSSGSQGPFRDYAPEVSKLERVTEDSVSTYRGERKTYYMGTGGHLSHLDFRFEIETPSGQMTFLPAMTRDSEGKLVQPFFQSEFFRFYDLECWHLQEAQPLAIKTVMPEA